MIPLFWSPRRYKRSLGKQILGCLGLCSGGFDSEGSRGNLCLLARWKLSPFYLWWWAQRCVKLSELTEKYTFIYILCKLCHFSPEEQRQKWYFSQG